MRARVAVVACGELGHEDLEQLVVPTKEKKIVYIGLIKFDNNVV